MWQRFTDRAKRTVFFAQEEAAQLGENLVSPEHLLLGLVREGDGVAARVLDRLGVPPSRVRAEVERRVVRGKGRTTQDMTLDPRARRVLDLAYDEARQLNNDHIGTEHLLLGLIREGDGVAARILAGLGIDLLGARQAAIAFLGGDVSAAPARAGTGGRRAPRVEEYGARVPLSGKVGQVLINAGIEAVVRGDPRILPAHILGALVREEDSRACLVLNVFELVPDEVGTEIRARLTHEVAAEGVPEVDESARLVLEYACQEWERLANTKRLNTEHVLLGILREGGSDAAQLLAEQGVTLDAARAEVRRRFASVGPLESGVKDRPKVLKALLKQLELALADVRQVLSEKEGEGMENLPGVLRGRSVLSIGDLSKEDLEAIFDVAARLKAGLKANPPVLPALLADKTLAMIFEKPSLRTRVSFETGMTQLGGHAINLQPAEIQMGKRESISDTASTLGRMVDLIMARTFAHDTVVQMARFAGVPVINGLSDREHPCQALADFLTIQEHKGRFAGLKLAWVGDGNNVCHSNLLLAAKVGAHFIVACPEGYEPLPDVVAAAQADAQAGGAQIQVMHDPREAVKDADVIFTDVWASMGQEAETAERARVFAPFQVNADLVALAKPDCIVEHCLPAHRNDEITDEVIDGPHSVVFDEAENRLHAQKAVMVLLA